MKAKITNVQLINEWHSEKWNKTYYDYLVEYDGKKTKYTSTNKEQNYFKVGEESEFTEEEMTGQKGKYIKIKPEKSFKRNSNYSRAVKKEQSRYSGFAVSYVKDLIISGHIPIEKWKTASKDIFDFMVELDKTLES